MSTILLIEDDALMRGMITHILRQAGHEVASAADGREGIHLFHHLATDLVVTDIFMPNMDGLEVIRLLRRTLSPVPILVLRNDQEVMATPLLLKILAKYQVVDTMVKPVSADRLLGCVAQALQQTAPAPPDE